MQSYMSIVAVVIVFLETSRVTSHPIVVACELQYSNSRLEQMIAESLLLSLEWLLLPTEWLHYEIYTMTAVLMVNAMQ
jgi:hypothetical protein